VVNVLLVAVMVAVVWGSISLHLLQQRGRSNGAPSVSNLAQAAAEASADNRRRDSALRLMRAILADRGTLISAWTQRDAWGVVGIRFDRP
jgi:hypothetical protein